MELTSSRAKGKQLHHSSQSSLLQVSRRGRWQSLRGAGRLQLTAPASPGPRRHHQWVRNVQGRDGQEGGGGGGGKGPRKHWLQDRLHGADASPDAVSCR